MLGKSEGVECHALKHFRGLADSESPNPIRSSAVHSAKRALNALVKSTWGIEVCFEAAAFNSGATDTTCKSTALRSIISAFRSAADICSPDRIGWTNDGADELTENSVSFRTDSIQTSTEMIEVWGEVVYLAGPDCFRSLSAIRTTAVEDIVCRDFNLY